MPVVSRWPWPSARGRPRASGPPAALLATAGLLAAALVAGCLAEPPPSRPADRPTAAPSTGALASGAAPPGTPTAAPAGSSPVASPGSGQTPIPDLRPSETSLAPYTVLCEDWGGEPPATTIDCGDAVGLALAAIGDGPGASVRRLEFWFGDGCDRGVPCAVRRADIGWVIARAAPSDTLAVRLAIDPTGELRAWPALPGPALPSPAFVPPTGPTGDLGPDLPAALRDRTPAPSCGTEDLTQPDAFATAARTCFLGGVLAGVPVELVSRSFSTEGHAIVTLFRFTGRGAVLRFVRSDAGWTGSVCGISPIRTSAVFILAGFCERIAS